MTESWTNKLFFGDNLEVLREHVPNESIGLIYLDPPFNSNATYNILFKEHNGTESAAQITAFEDTWHWGQESQNTYEELIKTGPKKLCDLLASFHHFLGNNDMMAYLTMIAIRLVELHRVLKSTGTIYLHCDPTASHYLKIVMDTIFYPKNFRNEIIWAYRGGGSPKSDFGRRHDVILRYSKTDRYNFYPDSIRIPYQAEGIKRTDNSMWGRHKGVDKVYKPHPLGKVPEDWWPIDVLNANDPERLGYPTQKPEVLMERIIKASSDESDIILDPFCGCGTTIAVAERFHRKWIGIDVTHLAIKLIVNRLKDTFREGLSPYEVIGVPRDLNGAIALAERSRHEFEEWALVSVDARPAQDKKKGADRGIDGFIYFLDDNSGKPKKIVIQVKSGKVSVKDIRDLIGVRKREEAAIAVFVTLNEPTKPMLAEAISEGFYESPNRYKYPHLQILTVDKILQGEEIQYPKIALNVTFKAAKFKEKGKQPEQGIIF